MRLPSPTQILAHCIAVVVGACLGCAAAAPAPAGTSLDNTAVSTFVDTGTGTAGRSASNTVHAIVPSTQSAQLTPASSTIATDAAGFTIPARLTNDGNVATTWFARFALVPGGGLVPQGARLVNDLNGNGIADPGEPVITPTTASTLAPGASVNLLIVGTIASGSTPGAATTFTLTVQTQDQSVTKTASARLVSSATQAVVTSATTPLAPVQGGTLTFAVEAHATDVRVVGSAVTVDGIAQSLVMLRVRIPANTSLATATSTTGMITLYHRRNDPPNQFFATPGPLANVDGIAFAAPSLTPGQSLAGNVTVAIAGNASGTLRSATTFTFSDQGIDRSTAATPIALVLPPLQSTLRAYGTGTYQTPIGVLRTGSVLFLRLTAAQCNLDADTAETQVVIVRSTLTGDVEHVTLVESGLNTGIFTIVSPLRTASFAGSPVRAEDGILQTAHGDRLTISASACGSDAAIDSLLVDPAGVVFDSRTDRPIPGVTVGLIDVLGTSNGGHPGGAAKVFGYDGVSDYPSTLVTDASGGYMFPLVAPGTYRLVLTTPAGYRAPSIVPPGQLPAERFVDALGSYGGNVVVDGTRVVIVDVPVDASPVDGLFVEKTASKTFAEIGDFVDYAVTVKNTSAITMPGVVLHDRLPRGFVYQRGTSRVTGAKSIDPVGTSTLDFGVGTIASGQAAIVTYRLRIGSGAKGGDGVNRAIATAGLSQSNTASVKVSLSEGGVFSDRAYLIGKVFADCNGNRVQDAGERGIPDVRIVLEDGTSATTDEDGKYSLYGLIPRTHVAKVDPTTLVEGSVLEVLDNRNAGDAGTRFVDLKNGELQRADFAVAGCTPALRHAIEQRRSSVARVNESESATRALLSATRATSVDARTLPSSGLLDAKGVVGRNGLAADTATSEVLDRSASSRLRAAVERPAVGETTTVATPDLASQIATLDATLGFVDLVDGAVLPASQATIRAKGPANAPWVLVVDGKRVDDRQVGTRSLVADRNLVAVEYVGVDLAAGDNLLELVASDPFGNVRARVAIHVRAPGRLAKLVVDAPADAKADGHSSIQVRVRLLDANDVPVTARTAVTLDATQGKWLAKDLDPREPGTQVFVEGGVLDVDLLVPNDAGKATLRASSGNLKTETPIVFVPDLRPLLAVGLIEGVINLRSLGSNALVPSQSGDTFEREIRNVAREFDHDQASAAARGALYLKGKVLGSTLLTLAYDSDKPRRERLFRDIQPDQFYPVYGDSSVKGFDAQSTSRLYVRVDQGTSYLLYGDYTTQTDDPARSLTQYNRTLTGAKGRYEEGPVRVDGFAAYTNSQQVIDELRGDGTSGPYALSRPNGLVNSEQVHLLTRDRDQPAIVIKDVPLTRFADYELEAFTGRILFKAPVPSVDADLNPVSIRVTYEVDSGGPNFWVGGVDAKVAVTDRASVGGTYIRDTDPSNHATLRGVNGAIRFTEKSVLVGEFAESDSDRYGLGKGRRVEYKQDDETVQARLYGGKTDVSFVNPNALLSQGRTEFGGKLGVKLSEQDRLIVDAIHTEDPLTGGRRDGVLARVERSLAGNIKVELGVRHANETVAPAQPTSLGATPNRFNSIRSKVTVPVPFLTDATVFGEYERALGEGKRQIAAIGGSTVLPNGGKLYARHEFISSLSGAYDLNSTQRLTTTVIGIDSDYMKDGHVFNEYRVGGGIDARSAEAAVGLRNLWRIADGVNVTTTAENIKPVGGPVDNRSTALTGAIDYTANPLWKGSARAEYRNGNTSDSRLLTTGGAYKLNDATTLLGKAIYSDLSSGTGSGGARRLARAQIGAAYRPVDSDVWNALARIEVKREQDFGGVANASLLPLDETATIASAHLNVSPSPDLNFAGRYGIKRATDRANGIESRSTTQLVGGRLIKDLDDRWDVGAAAFLLASNGIHSRSYALGLEAGYRVATNLWVSVGYNVSGFKDKDLAGEDYTQRGAYLRLRYKFDENLFGAKPQAGDRRSGS